MRSILIIAITLSTVIGGMSSCNNVKKFKEDREALQVDKQERKANRKKDKEDIKDNIEVAVTEEIDSEIAVVDSVTEVLTKEIGDSLYISYERTACYGRCPIYKLRIFDSGYVTYEGINFVEKMGMYHTRMAEPQLIEIETRLNDMYFFQLEDAYDNENIQDLPAKIIVVNKPNNKKRIKARYQVPQELVDMFNRLDELIDAQDWTPGK